MLTAAMVVALSLRVPDRAGMLNHRAIPGDGAAAIVAICAPTASPIHCAGVLVTLAFRESGNNEKAVHDGGMGCGAFGVLCTYPHATWLEQTKSAWGRVIDSAASCREPLAKYASGRCDAGLSVAREYMRIARKIVADLCAEHSEWCK